MAKSLQEQLLAAGLADEKKARQVRDEQRKAKKQQKQKKASAPSEAEERRQRAQQAQAEKAERDREINRQRQVDAERKAIRAQVRQIVQQHGVDRGNGDVAYNFVLDRKVKKIYVTAELSDQLARGRLGIVGLDDAFHLLPAVVIEKIRQRDTETPVVLAQPDNADTPDEDDPYADYQIPDDLMW